MSIECAIIEDEPLAQDVLKNYIEEVDGLSLKATLNNGMEAYHYLTQQKVDLLFLDIEMPKLQGTELLNSLPYAPYVIFTTAYSQYALESFEHNTIDYLTKPIAFDRFLKAIQKVFTFIDEPPSNPEQSVSDQISDFLFLKFNHYYRKIHLDHILWIEGLADYQKIITREEVYFYYSTLKQLEEALPKEQFLRVHQSYIVNIKNVDGFQGNRLFLGNDEILIGRKYREKVKQALGIE